MSSPLISIVTPSYNQGQFIEETITSVLDQNYPNLEYIIIDGGSTDNSVEIIKKYAKHLKYWVSEKDKGQSNAINKGLQHCTGEIFNWLNSDDYLEKGVLNKIAAIFDSKQSDLVAGKIQYFGEDIKPYPGDNSLLTAEGLMTWGKGVAFNQPGVWMKTNLIKECGGIREDYHYSFDREMLVRYLYFFHNVAYSDDVFVYFRLHDESKTVSSHNHFEEEGNRIFSDVLNNPRLSQLHRAAQLSISCRDWSRFLKEIRTSDESKIKKLKKIFSNLNKHPHKSSYLRMTAGAVNRIIRDDKSIDQ